MMTQIIERLRLLTDRTAERDISPIEGNSFLDRPLRQDSLQRFERGAAGRSLVEPTEGGTNLLRLSLALKVEFGFLLFR